jgi:hypothetical protein
MAKMVEAFMVAVCVERVETSVELVNECRSWMWRWNLLLWQCADEKLMEWWRSRLI